MTTLAARTAPFLAVLIGTVLASAPLSADGVAFSKDVGPNSAACDNLAKGTAAWTSCVGRASAAMSDDELFYAGYWLAKSGHYEQAISYLKLAQKKDERVLTYIGYATRKLGDVQQALPIYRQALDLNPNYVVARAYLGEAFLSLGEPAKARDELAEIERRCGATCAAYADLKGHIADFETGSEKG
jgi:tetratricopeptide (TPR) repeat protein